MKQAHGQIGVWRALLATLLSMAVTACGPAPANDVERPGDDGDSVPGAEETFTVSGTVSGFSADKTTVTLLYPDATGLTRFELVDVTSNGPIVFETPILKGSRFNVHGQVTDDFTQRCDSNYADGAVSEIDIIDVEIVCADAYSVGGTVQNLRGSGLVVNVYNEARGVEVEVDAGNEFEAPGWLSGEGYRVSIKQQPHSPSQDCVVLDGVGVVADADVDNVTIFCADARVGGTVTGLLGSGLVVSLGVEVDDNGTIRLLDLEDLPVAENGEFTFDLALNIGSRYEVRVGGYPTDPDQDCNVENGAGTIGDGVPPGGSLDVNNIEVNCAVPLREYRYDNDATHRTDGPLYSDKVTIGEFKNSYQFGPRSAISIGDVLGLEETELFELDLNNPTSDGVVYSSETGKTYWLAVESPAGNTDTSDAANAGQSHYVTLDTTWRFRRTEEIAGVKLVISAVNLGAFHDNHPRNGKPSRVFAHASQRIRAFTADGTRRANGPFFHAHSGTTLSGTDDANKPESRFNRWQVAIWTEPQAQYRIWGVDELTLNDEAAALGNIFTLEPSQAALVQLVEPIEVEIDLSNIAIGDEFVVISNAKVAARNSYSVEGSAAAYLRDPLDYPDDQPEGGLSFETVGVVMLDVGELTIDDSLPGAPVPSACDSGSSDRSVLEFEFDRYQISEDTPDDDPFVSVVRRGSATGLVSAQVTLAGISAEADEDFTQRTFTVRFGDGDAVPRTIELPIINDGDLEENEDLVLTLIDPAGCAEIGTVNEATVTIIDNDPDPGTVAFGSESYEIVESGGFAAITIQRTGAAEGVVVVSLSTADGTAVSPFDYEAVSKDIFFGDGDRGSKVVQIPILDDAEPGADKTVLLSLTSVRDGILGEPDTAVLTILEDDVADAGTLRFGSGSYMVAEPDGTVSVDVVRDGGGTGAVTVELATSDAEATAGADFEAVQTVISFADGDTAAQTIDIVIVNDTEDEGDHAFNVMLFDPTGGATLGTPATVPVIIVDDDGPPPLPPAAPVLGATPGPKELVFDWASVVGATSYRLLMNPDGVSGFTPISGDIALNDVRYVLPIAAHLFDWANARFILQACNSGGCTDSNAVSVESLMLGAIGFFKASNTDGRQQRQPDGGDQFGWAVALSGNGQTLAVSAYDEDSGAVFVNGDQSDNSESDSGAVYVFSADDTGWTQQAYVKAPNTDNFDGFGTSLALSRDGNTLVIGASGESGNAAGVNGDQSDNSLGSSGAVYVYGRSGGVWSLQAYLKASNPDALDRFGHAVTLSADGDTLAVGALGEDSGAVGVDGDQTSNDASGSGAVYVFARSGNLWSQLSYLKSSNSEAADRFGHALAMNADGTVLAVAAPGEDSAATGVDGNQSDNSATGSTNPDTSGAGAVYVFVDSNGQWVQQAYLKASNTDADDLFGSGLALSAAGDWLAVGARREDSGERGVNQPNESDNTAEDAGAVYVFNSVAGQWAQRAYVKASNTEGVEFFGTAVAISADGRWLAVGAEGEDSRGVGINGDPSQPLKGLNIGAAYVFGRDQQTDDWSQYSYVKAPNSDQDSFGFGRSMSFGNALALSEGGEVLAIGAYREPSAATGINGDQVNEDATGAGAVFVY